MSPKELAEHLEQHPLHVWCVFSGPAAVEEFRNDSYSPWYVAHHDPAKLSDAILGDLYRYWMQYVDQSESGDLTEFMGWLEDHNRPTWEGYIVLNSGPEGGCLLESA